MIKLHVVNQSCDEDMYLMRDVRNIRMIYTNIKFNLFTNQNVTAVFISTLCFCSFVYFPLFNRNLIHELS